MTVGYSGTPLAKKLGIKAGMRVVVAGGPDGDADLLARADAVAAAATPALVAITDAADLLPPLVRDTLRRYADTVGTLARDAAGLLAWIDDWLTEQERAGARNAGA